MKARAFLPSKLQTKVTTNGILLGGIVGTVEATVVDVEGHNLFRGKVSDRLVPLRKDQMRGLLFVTVSNRVTGTSVHIMVNAVH